MRIFFFIIIFSFLYLSSFGQSFLIEGVIQDKNTGEPISFSTIQFIGTTTGTSADDEGKFTFQLDRIPADSVIVRAVGYTSKHLAIDRGKKEQELIIEIERQDYKLNEFVVHAGVNPALIILKKIIKNKPLNDPSRLASYSQQVYNKIEVDLDRLNREKIKKSKLFKSFAFLLDNIDSTTEEKPFLPVFLTETISDFYYRKSPKKQKEIITATKTSGLKNKSVTQFLGTMYQQINVYENFINVFDKDFPSPINNNATLYYKYQLVDTQMIDQKQFYHITFQPRHKKGQYFFGDFWVHDSTFSIQKMDLQVTKEANINFINRINIVQQFTPVQDSIWFPTLDKLIVDFSPLGAKKLGLIGRKTTHYYDIEVNDSSIDEVLARSKYKGNNLFVEDSAYDHEDDFWLNKRHVKLDKNEQSVYKMIDTLENMPLFRTYADIVKFLVKGTKELGPIEIGPYYYLFSANNLEKVRLRLGLGTTPDLFKEVHLNGYLAYGINDRKFKGGLQGLWLLNRRPRTYFFASYMHDLDNGGIHDDNSKRRNNVTTDNMFAQLIRRHSIPQKFVMVDEKRVELYKEWLSGFSLQGNLTNTQYNPYAPLPVKNLFPTGKAGYQPMNNTEVGLSTRYAWREKFLEGNYFRTSLGSKYPILKVTGSMGIKGFMKSSYDYKKLEIDISDRLGIPPFGKIDYSFYGGKVWGDLPYMMLNLHPGNEILYYNKTAFNMMNRFEFLSDQWAGFRIEHEFGGGIFNYIPLIKKLNLRQFWTAKGVVGKLSNGNRALNLNQGFDFQTLDGKPYLEVGTGIENILRFFRVDFVWRVLPSDQVLPNHRNFGVFGSILFNL